MILLKLAAAIVAVALYRYIVQRSRELRWFEERGIPEPRPR